MGKRGGSSAEEPMTDLGKPFQEMSGAEKGWEFDSSHSDPRGYACRNFGSDNQGQRQGRHAK